MEDYVGEGVDFFITDPNEMEGDGRPNLIMFNGLQGFAFDLNLPINGEWSDLTVQFEFIKKGKGYYSVILNDIMYYKKRTNKRHLDGRAISCGFDGPLLISTEVLFTSSRVVLARHFWQAFAGKYYRI